jgi:hypothetical protein
LDAGSTIRSVDSFVQRQRDEIQGIGRTDEYKAELKLRVDQIGLE